MAIKLKMLDTIKASSLGFKGSCWYSFLETQVYMSNFVSFVFDPFTIQSCISKCILVWFVLNCYRSEMNYYRTKSKFRGSKQNTFNVQPGPGPKQDLPTKPQHSSKFQHQTGWGSSWGGCRHIDHFYFRVGKLFWMGFSCAMSEPIDTVFSCTGLSVYYTVQNHRVSWLDWRRHRLLSKMLVPGICTLYNTVKPRFS